jgi:hypothetical protein
LLQTRGALRMYQVTATYEGLDMTVDQAVDMLIDIAYDELEWSMESRSWIWFIDSEFEADMLYNQLSTMRALQVDIEVIEHLEEA